MLIDDLGVSKNRGTPKSSILIGFSIINHPFWGTPIFGNTHLMLRFQKVVKVELVESKERWEQLQDEEKVPSSKQKSCTQNA